MISLYSIRNNVVTRVFLEQERKDHMNAHDDSRTPLHAYSFLDYNVLVERGKVAVPRANDNGRSTTLLTKKCQKDGYEIQLHQILSEESNGTR